MHYLNYRRAIFLISLTLGLIGPGSFFAQPARDIGKKLDTYMTQAAQFGFSGAVLVAVDDRVVLEKGYGYADRKRRIHVKADTVLELGSITKQFTAAAIMKLEVMGKLKTEDPLSKYLDGVPADKAMVTLHQLLTHTAGFPEYSGGDYDVSPKAETLERILKEPLTNAPGATMNYSNAGYSVLAAVVEKVSGQSYESFLNDNLFKPAGMTHTGYVLPKFDKARLPRGYNGSTDFGTVLDHVWSPEGPYWNLFGNGGILSTVGDMFRWYKALEGNVIFPDAAKKKMFTPLTGTYAYGWNVLKTSNGTSIGHSGAGDFGFNAKMNWYPDKKIVVITMSNAGEYFGGTTFASVTSGKINSILFGGSVATARPVKVFSPSGDDSRFVGEYRMASGGKIVIQSMDNTLTLEPVGQDAVDVIAPDLGELASKGNSSAKAIISGILANDPSALGRSIAAESVERYRTLLTQRLGGWATKDGELRDFEVLGTVPAWWSDDQQPTTFLRFHYAKMDHILRFHWRDGKISGVGGEAIKSPVTIPMVQTGPAGFAGWHLALSKGFDLRFQISNGKVTGLTITAGGKAFTATRV